MSKMSDLDKKLQELALTNWGEFCMLVGVDKRQIMVCIMRREGKTLGQIAQKLNIPRSTVRNITIKCVPKSGTDDSKK